MQDLKDVTNNVHYENYRSRKLAAVTYNGVDNNKTKGQLTKWVHLHRSHSPVSPWFHVENIEDLVSDSGMIHRIRGQVCWPSDSINLSHVQTFRSQTNRH